MRKWFIPLLVLLWTHGAAFTAAGEGYDFPLADPLMATVAGTPVDEALSGVIVREKVYGVKVFRNRALPPTMRDLKEYRFSLAWQKEPAPLIFVIPGTGSNYRSGKVRNLQKLYHDAGFNVICLNSTFTRRFAAMGSVSSMPGITAEDAMDLYHVMKLAREKVGDKIRVTDHYLTGYSLGGLTAAFIAHLDETEHVFDFRKVLLVNPPVDLYTSTRILDDFVTRNLRQRADVFFDNIFLKASKYFEFKGDVYIDEEFLYDINRIAPLTVEELEGLIGVAFRMSLASVAFSVDMITNGGYIKEKSKVMHVWNSTTPYFKEVLHWTFEDYLDRVLLPHWQRLHPGDDKKALIHKIGLKSLESYLAEASKIGIVHNDDDIILGPGDISFIRKTFGKRARIYPRGGHLGNMLYPPNRAYMINFFQ